MERLLDRFRAAHTQVLGISVDSIYSHANWARDLGGVSFPLLADFHPKGAVAASYGLYLEDQGITDRATVLIDAGGTVRHCSSVTPDGERDIAALAALCEQLDREHGGGLEPRPAPRELGKALLYVRSNCGFSRAALLARDNLHLRGVVEVLNVTEDPRALEELRRATGKVQAPCLVLDGEPCLESSTIIERLVERAAPI